MIPGVDVSHWQVEIDWSEAKRAGVKFAFIKATEFPDKKTTLFIDDLLYRNLQGVSANGIYWSAYHFFRTHIDPVIQAQVFVETVGQFTSLPPVLDLEAAGCKGEKLNLKVRAFLQEVERLTNRKPIIYTSGGFWRSYMMYEKRVHADWAREYPLWMAQYTTLWPTPLYPWAGWDFWQYSDKGKLPGFKTHMDLNWFNGSEEELVERFNVGDGSYTVPAAVLADANAETDTEAKLMREFEQAKQAHGNFRGDYQEAGQEPKRYFANGRRPSFHSAHAAHAAQTAAERQWVRSYFIDKAVRQAG
ncbi:MAG: glycoside hydrolase family 25 protein [Gammaproteobacteria bacterium]|nr:glycoside hydrolase family 25 protein [Gammaproteobacteria bacterium]